MIIIPMAGLSSRFFKAGYTVPKYQLDLPNGQNIFEWAISTFENYFLLDKFVFIIRDVYDTYNFVEKYCTKLGIKDFDIIVLDYETRGQAETVALGLRKLDSDIQDQECYIFNIDSKRYNFIKPEIAKSHDGYLEVFKGEGEHWSFIELDDKDNVVRTTEKVRISDLCSDGLYFFKDASEFLLLVQDALDQKDFVKGELYIAPLYNRMIQRGSRIGYELIERDQISFCGTPSEYLDIYSKLKEESK